MSNNNGPQTTAITLLQNLYQKPDQNLPNWSKIASYIPPWFSDELLSYTQAHDMHDYERRLEHALIALHEDKFVSKKNKQTILSCIRYRNTQGPSIPRQVHYIVSLRKLAKLFEGKSFSEAEKQELVHVISEIEKEDIEYDTKWTEKECIKCFCLWLKGGEDEDEYPEEVKWIESKRTLNHKILPDDLLTQDKVRLMALVVSMTFLRRPQLARMR
jgi:hypothetical protein